MSALFEKLIDFIKIAIQKLSQDWSKLYGPAASILLLIVFITAIVSHVIFSVGLHYDGTQILMSMIEYNSFHFFERSRRIFHILYQLPAYLFIKFLSFEDLFVLTQVFSFGLVWIHIISIAGCWFVLPKNKKSVIFFPLFAFLIGPLTALDHSISVSLSVFSYVWLTAFTLHYSDLSNTIHKLAFIIIPLPLILSHELMSYASLLLIFILFKKDNFQKTFINKALIKSMILFFIIVCCIASYFIFIPESHGNRDRFLSHLLNLKFLYYTQNGQIYIYPYTALALVITTIPFFQLLQFSAVRQAFLFCACLVALAINVILLVPNSFLSQIIPHHIYPFTFNRVWVFLVLSFALCLWFLFEKQILQFKKSKVFLAVCLISSLSLVKWRTQIDYSFYKFQKQFSENLKSHEGIFEEEIINPNEDFTFSPAELKNFYLHWLPFSSSIIYPRSRKIKVVILNPSHPDCLKACQNKKTIYDYYHFNFKKENFNCQRECLSYSNYQFDKEFFQNDGYFFDFTSLERDLKRYKEN